MSEWEEKCYCSVEEARDAQDFRDEALRKIALLERQAFVLELERVSETEGLIGFDFYTCGYDDVIVEIRWKKALLEQLELCEEGDPIGLEIVERMDFASAAAKSAVARLSKADITGAVEAAGIMPTEEDCMEDAPENVYEMGWSGECRAGSAEGIARHFGWDDVASRIQAGALGKSASAAGYEREKKHL